MTAEPDGLIVRAGPDAGWLVVDASVVVKWFLDEELSQQARLLLRSPEELLAPDFLIAEVGNVFLKKVRGGEMSPASIGEAFEIIDRFVTRRPADRFFHSAFAIAIEHGRSFYDSLYVALALQEGCQLVIADERLYNALKPAFGETMLWVEDMPP